jgi:Flp pilus assembly protein TadG
MKSFVILRLRRLYGADEGQVLVLVALGLMVLMMMAALGLDVGYLHLQKQQMQKAADAAAIAGATALSYNGEFQVAAQNDAAANGFTNGNNGVSVAVHNPPQTQGDPFLGNGQYVEVIITKQQPTFFMRIANLGLVNMTSRAVANSQGIASGCIYALDPSDAGTLVVDSGVTVQTTCSVYVESNNSSALNSSGSLSVGGPNPQTIGIGVVAGSYAGSGFSPSPTTGIPPFNNPLGAVTPPNVATCGTGGQNGNTFSPGVYYNGINITTAGPYNFMPGTYCIVGGGLNVSPGAQITGTGVTFYLTTDANHQTYGGVNLGGSSATSISAPTAGPLAGILFFQDPSVTISSGVSNTFDGTGGATFTGALYFPTTKVLFKGTSGVIASPSPIVAYQLEFQGNTQLTNDRLPNNGGPVPGSVLVE